MKRLILNIPDEMDDELLYLAETLGLKKSSIAKIALDKYLKDNGRI